MKKIGIGANLYQEKFNVGLIDAVKLAINDGFDFVELCFIEETLEEAQKYIKELNKIDTEYLIHSNFIDFNLASLNEYIRNASIQEVFDTLEYANQINAKFVTFHPGRFRKNRKELAYKNLERCLDTIIEKYNGQAVFSLENMGLEADDHILKSAEEWKALIKKYPELKVTYDLAHAAQVYRDDFHVLTEVLSDRVSYCHLSGYKPGLKHIQTSLKESTVDLKDFLINTPTDYLRIEIGDYDKAIESKDYVKSLYNEIFSK